MRRNSSFYILIAFCLNSSFLGIQAQAQEDSPLCLEAVYNVSDEMAGYGLNLVQPSAEPIQDPMNPYPGSYVRVFPVVAVFNSENPFIRKGAFIAENFMNSRSIQLRLAKRVMEACPSTSKVTFGIENSGYHSPYFRMPSGLIRGGIPLDCGRDLGSILQWGYFVSC